jgi:Mycothiol maleylpyruvate isomerase N-terminal domain
VPTDGDDVRSALIRQWELIANALPGIDVARPSRIDGWNNGEVLAHLSVQPHLVTRFLRTASNKAPDLGVADNLAGTKAFKDLIDTSAREGAMLDKFDIAGPLAATRASVLSAPLAETVETFQGSISVEGYLVTRCVEAVVHGADLVEPVSPDPVAEAITATALLQVLAASAPNLVVEARALPPGDWIDIATGRKIAIGPLSESTPVMS